MFIGSELTRFFDDCRNLADEEELRLILADMTRRLGFEQFALNHHVDLVGPPTDAIMLMNYDPAWIDRSLSQGYHLDDPVHAASARSAFGFAWHDVPFMIRMSGRQRKILDEARAYGLRDGFTVPVHVPGEYRGTCSFGAHHVDLTLERKIMAQLVGVGAFESARRLVNRRRGGRPQPIPRLSQRQLDCMALVALGKSDDVIGQLLGRAPSTVHQHVGEAMRRYSVSTRVQLIVRALFDGQIVFNSLF